VSGWQLESAGSSALTFGVGSRQVVLRVEGPMVVLRGYRSLDLPWSTI
jgi:hypothetical protein